MKRPGTTVGNSRRGDNSSTTTVSSAAATRSSTTNCSNKKRKYCSGSVLVVPSSPSPLLRVPTPIIIHVVGFLDNDSRMELSTVCKYLHGLFDDDEDNDGTSSSSSSLISIKPVLEISAASDNKDDDKGRTSRLVQTLRQHILDPKTKAIYQRRRHLKWKDVRRFLKGPSENVLAFLTERATNEYMQNNPLSDLEKAKLNGIVSLELIFSSTVQKQESNYYFPSEVLYLFPNIREIDMTNIEDNFGGSHCSIYDCLDDIVYSCRRLEKLTWNNIGRHRDTCLWTTCGWNLGGGKRGIREVIMDNAIFHEVYIADRPAQNTWEKVQNLRDYPTTFLFHECCQGLERLSIRKAHWRKQTLKGLDRREHVTAIPQNALIKFVRHAPPLLRWFRSDLTKANIAMLQLERPTIQFLN